MAALLFPMGNISGEVTVAGRTFNQSASGFGDPMIEFNVNVIGPPAQKNIPDVLRYEPGFSIDLLADLAVPIGEYDSSQPLNIGQNRWYGVDLLADLAIPIGEYDSDQPLNIGQNRWYGRFGVPTIVQIGPWVPGQRMTLELLPAVWFFGNNDDYVGQTLETDPLFQLDAHVTRDITDKLWASLDAAWYYGGEATINDVKGEKLNNIGLGITLGYQINDNLNLTVGYKSTINDSSSDDLRMDSFMVSLVFGWHPLLEGSRRLKDEK